MRKDKMQFLDTLERIVDSADRPIDVQYGRQLLAIL
jgi:hypothetical protein